MNIFLHMCCGPCSVYPVACLREQGHQLTGWFYNPNIHPYKEFRRRLDTAAEFARRVDLTLLVKDDYTLEDFLSRALNAPDSRCAACYRLRLYEAARTAKAGGFDAFTTTLLVSPYQKHELIRQAAEAAAAECGIAFFYQDFRQGWQQGVAGSIEMELYRQPYCGCIFSERDRYWKPKKQGG
ncbi:MAG: epoxyqueuosine reductase QueH [Sporomusaceae bacterium]|nr:epoxyqueuosine reductase QueH [Sporomusaceae bacterium]